MGELKGSIGVREWEQIEKTPVLLYFQAGFNDRYYRGRIYPT